MFSVLKPAGLAQNPSIRACDRHQAELINLLSVQTKYAICSHCGREKPQHERRASITRGLRGSGKSEIYKQKLELYRMPNPFLLLQPNRIQ